MAKTETMVSCPFCRRVYKMMLDRALAKERGTRASCGRCGNSFELASRIVVTMNSNIGTGTASPRSVVPPPPPPRPARAEQALPVQAADIESDEASSTIAAEVARAADDIRHVQAREAAGTIERASVEPMAPLEPAAIDGYADRVEPQAITASSPAMVAETQTPETAPPSPVAPRDWLDRADPGLLGLVRPEPDTVVALRRLLP